MKKIIIIAALSAFMIGLCSCADSFMETKSTQTVDQSQMFETTAGGMMAVNGLH